MTWIVHTDYEGFVELPPSGQKRMDRFKDWPDDRPEPQATRDRILRVMNWLAKRRYLREAANG